MQLKTGADVYSSAGEKIGSLDRVVLNPDTKEVTHLIVEKGIIFSTNKVIPIEYVNKEEGGKIALEKNAEELEVLPSYDPDSYVSLDKTDYPEEDQEVKAVYWYPSLYTSWWMSSGGAPAWYPKPRFVKAENVIPDETIALEEGAKVISKDGEHIGNVEEVIVESAEHVATHFVIGKGLFLKERKLVPTVWIADVDDDQVTLSVMSNLVDRLPEYDRVN
jgi:uncharacterized protein YrrD